MFDKIKYRKIKELYDLAIENILEKEYRCAFNCLVEFDEKSKCLLLILHSNKVDKSPLTFDQWNNLEFMATNASTLLSYLHVYMSNYYTKKCDEFFNNIELAADFAQKADFEIHNSINHKQFEITEPKLKIEGETQNLPQLNYLKNLYETKMTYKEREKVRQRTINLHRERERVREEKRNSTPYVYVEPEEASNKFLEDFKDLIMQGDFFLSMDPERSVSLYKQAYHIAKKHNMEDKMNSASNDVVCGYASWIRKKITSTGFIGGEMTKVKYFDEAIALCDEALDWTDSSNEDEIIKLKREADYERDLAYRQYNN